MPKFFWKSTFAKRAIKICKNRRIIAEKKILLRKQKIRQKNALLNFVGGSQMPNKNILNSCETLTEKKKAPQTECDAKNVNEWNKKPYDRHFDCSTLQKIIKCIYQNSPKKDIFCVDKVNGDISLNPFAQKASPHECKYLKDGIFMVGEKVSQSHKKRKKNYVNEFKDFVDQSFFNAPDDDVLKESVAKLYKKLNFLKIDKYTKGSKCTITKAKNTKKYNRNLRKKLNFISDEICKNERQTFALTLTYNYNKLGISRIYAWRHYSQMITQTLKPLVKKYDAKYLWIKESTSKGYPHVHILFTLPKGTLPYYSKLKNNKPLRYGELFKTVKESTSSPVFKLCAIKGEKTKFYLQKYITKYSDQDFFSIRNVPGELTTEQRKAVYCSLYTSITNTRQIGYCYSVEKTNVETEFFDSVQGEYLARQRQFLINSCTNVPDFNYSKISICSAKSISEQAGSDLSKIKDPDSDLCKEIAENAKKIGCESCLLKDIAQFIGHRSGNIRTYLAIHSEFEVYETIDECLNDEKNPRRFFSAIYYILDEIIKLMKTYQITYQEAIYKTEFDLTQSNLTTLEIIETQNDEIERLSDEISEKFQMAKFMRNSNKTEKEIADLKMQKFSRIENVKYLISNSNIRWQRLETAKQS